jgi:sec-independent protein translocase protein TatB
MELQLLIVLIIAFIVLGPERMMDVAIKLGEAMRKVREMWDEIRVQSYMEEMNKKIMEEESELDERVEDETEEEFEEEVIAEDEHGESGTSDNVPHGTSEGTESKTS